MDIRALQSDDYAAWLPLWEGNNLGQSDEEITAQTWSRLVDPFFPVQGLCAEDNGKIIGIIHYILHPTTGHLNNVCYMQDVFVDPICRKQGIAAKMVQALSEIGKKEKWARMYWLAEEDNLAAQKLYKNIGVKLDFTFHVMPL